MYPRRIIEQAEAVGVDMIALADHNSAENVRAAMEVAQGKNLVVIPAMEVTSEEEAHILGLFETVDDVLALQAVVSSTLPIAPAKAKVTNDQVIVNEEDEVMGFSPYLLLGATRFTVYEVVEKIHSFNGLAIASHIDRGAFSIPSQLGFIPDDLRLDGLEISPQMTRSEARRVFPQYHHLPLVSFSDAHRPDDIGVRYTDFFLAEPTFVELCKAFCGEGRRKIIES